MNDQHQTPQMSSTSMPVLSRDGGPIPIAWVEDLFERLAAIVGSAMATVYAGAKPERVKAEWAEALATFSSGEIKRGLAATRTRKFAPNLPEFLHLCRPALDPETAWIEAEAGMRSHAGHMRFAWSHPAVYWAARDFISELRSETFAKQRKRWELALTASFAAGAWASPPDPTLQQLAGPSQQDMVNPVIRERALARIREQRKAMTGFATKAEQVAAQQALAGPLDELLAAQQEMVR